MASPGDEGRKNPFGSAYEERRERGTHQKPTLWERIEGSSRGPRPALTHDQIARAAVEIADADGLSAVSMRHLAERLGVATMGLYRYVTGKDEIYELMLDVVAADLALPDAGWRTVADSYARQLRALSLRHRWMYQAFARVPASLSPANVAVMEKALSSIEGLGLDVDTMMAVFGTVNSFARGAVFAEVTQREALERQGWKSEDDARLAYVPWVRWMLNSGRYPKVARYVIEGSNEDDAEWQFEFGLGCVLDGIAARLGI
ncbi:TetR/AcrR family transcriptional regulator C-terminal domain-containing protein [Actinoallomurus bryophytorum]|uniref:TetR family transcriptional regulator n=1 Tax=Actinoallomurus bryophytorum TaxID=1490222 RepID=A0A543BSX8_9ACTN|nr:TetR/AcrR family transcriptional regulator [Actinoallomurus bryophytorum]TQL87937.1 TetR family transcriptional regulator [Actinoallomurus bryophytorum]